MSLVPAAEFRGPGVHHNFDDSDSGYDVETDHRSQSFGVGGHRGKIIFLGDGSEVLTDSDDTEMFDREDKDLDSQVSKASASSDDGKEEAKADDAHVKGESATEDAAVKVGDASSSVKTTEAAKPTEAEAPAAEASAK